MIQYGLGKHIFVQPLDRIPKAVEVFLKSLFISEVCYTGTIVFAKFSILAFYWRLFSRNTFVRWSVIVIAGMVTCWGIAVVSVEKLYYQRIQLKSVLAHYCRRSMPSLKGILGLDRPSSVYG